MRLEVRDLSTQRRLTLGERLGNNIVDKVLKKCRRWAMALTMRSTSSSGKDVPPDSSSSLIVVSKRRMMVVGLEQDIDAE